MYKDKRIAVVVPAYNEEKLISRVIETMPRYVDQIYIVDDCSRDKTVAVVERLQSDSPYGSKVQLIRHEENQGVGAAIVTGYKIAVEQGMDVVAVMAGDAQMNPDDLERVIDPIAEGTADYVKGNRLFTGEAWKRIPRYRYLGNAALSMATKIASGYWHVADSQTGYTAISAAALRLLPLDKLYKRYGYPNHLLVMLNVYNMRVDDVPVEPVYNVGEVSGIRLRTVIPRMSWLLVKQFLWRMKEKYIIRDFHPLLFFYTAGALLLVTCLGFTVRLLWVWSELGQVPQTTALVCMLTMISGLQFLLFGMWFDMDYNRSLRGGASQHPVSSMSSHLSSSQRAHSVSARSNGEHQAVASRSSGNEEAIAQPSRHSTSAPISTE